MPQLRIGPYIQMPISPTLLGQITADERVDLGKQREFRAKYDWKAYMPSGLAKMERHWGEYVQVLDALLPRDLGRGINLGTFNGAYQKAWMRAGYTMYGIEKHDLVDELHEYGCEGHQDDIFDLGVLAGEGYDFAALDRVICTEGFYRVARPPFFEAIMRTLRPGGVLIGVLYGWYDAAVIAELASYGALTLWPSDSQCLTFRVLLGEPTNLPALGPPSADDPAFRSVSAADGLVGWHLPSNQVVTGNDTEFAPESPHYKLLTRR